MVDLSITAANVKWTSGTRPRQVIAGAAITRGQALRLDAATNEYVPADASAAGTSDATAIALTDGQDGSDMLVALAGAVVNIGATTTAGTAYVLSGTAGGIAPVADLGAGDTPNLIAWGSGSASITLVFAESPVTI